MLTEINQKSSQALFGNNPPESVLRGRQTWSQTIRETKAFMDGLASAKKAMRKRSIVI